MVKKRGSCSECGLWLPLNACEACSTCFCDRHILAHFNQHLSDKGLFHLAQKELGHRLPS